MPQSMLVSSAIEELDYLETHVQSRLAGRVRNFQVLPRGHGIILKGVARTYYAKQLAQHAVMQASDCPILANEIEVSRVFDACDAAP
jgi:hypothetical protein